MRPSVPDVHITDPQDAELAAYRALAGQAVLGLIFGLLAPLALVDPMLWSIPVVGVFLSGWAIRRIKNAPRRWPAGRWPLAGLTLSLLFLAAVPADWFAYRRMVRNEARQFSALWFKYLTHDDPQKAHQLTLAPQSRQPLDDRLWDFYRNGACACGRSWKTTSSRPWCGPCSPWDRGPRCGSTRRPAQTRENDNDLVDQLYAVTYEEGGERKSFFVLVRMERRNSPAAAPTRRILQTEGGLSPVGWSAP